MRVAKLPLSAVLRTRTKGEKEGLMKALLAGDDRILSGLSL